MAKDPAFLFYYQDFLVGTDDFTNEQVGAYIRCLCIQAAKGGISVNHMIKICESQQIQNVIKKKFIWYPEENIFRNERLSEEIEKRKKYCESRGKNKKGKKHIKIISKSYDNHMEDENEIISNDLINDINEISNNIQRPKIEIKHPDLFKRMMEVYKASFPAYFDDYEADYPSCISIAQKTEKLKNWASNSVLNGHLDEFLAFWGEIVQYVANDDWLSSRSLRDLSTREWQRLGQHMSKTPKERAKKSKKDEKKSEYEREIEAKREAARSKTFES
jgi:hypothetical protein